VEALIGFPTANISRVPTVMNHTQSTLIPEHAPPHAPYCAAGKSALVEALMGFQFNHVGGGTKTRRPIALHMRYNPAAATPICHLMPEAGCEREVTLQQLQVGGMGRGRVGGQRGGHGACSSCR
jgi:hypothetical protein